MDVVNLSLSMAVHAGRQRPVAVPSATSKEQESFPKSRPVVRRDQKELMSGQQMSQKWREPSEIGQGTNRQERDKHDFIRGNNQEEEEGYILQAANKAE